MCSTVLQADQAAKASRALSVPILLWPLENARLSNSMWFQCDFDAGSSMLLSLFRCCPCTNPWESYRDTHELRPRGLMVYMIHELNPQRRICMFQFT